MSSTNDQPKAVVGVGDRAALRPELDEKLFWIYSQARAPLPWTLEREQRLEQFYDDVKAALADRPQAWAALHQSLRDVVQEMLRRAEYCRNLSNGREGNSRHQASGRAMAWAEAAGLVEAALGAAAPHQEELSSPVLAFQAWAERYVRDSGRKLTQDEYFLAQQAFFAAHPGKGPTSEPMTTGAAAAPARPQED